MPLGTRPRMAWSGSVMDGAQSGRSRTSDWSLNADRSTAHCFTGRPSFCSTLATFDCRLPVDALAVVDLGGAGDAVGRLGDLLDALLHEAEHLGQLALDDRAHGVQLVVEARAVDQVDALGDVLADAFALAERDDAHFQQDHGGDLASRCRRGDRQRRVPRIVGRRGGVSRRLLAAWQCGVARRRKSAFAGRRRCHTLLAPSDPRAASTMMLVAACRRDRAGARRCAAGAAWRAVARPRGAGAAGLAAVSRAGAGRAARWRTANGAAGRRCRRQSWRRASRLPPVPMAQAPCDPTVDVPAADVRGADVRHAVLRRSRRSASADEPRLLAVAGAARGRRSGNRTGPACTSRGSRACRSSTRTARRCSTWRSAVGRRCCGTAPTARGDRWAPNCRSKARRFRGSTSTRTGTSTRPTSASACRWCTAARQWEAKFSYYHLSSHMGDEFAIREDALGRADQLQPRCAGGWRWRSIRCRRGGGTPRRAGRFTTTTAPSRGSFSSASTSPSRGRRARGARRSSPSTATCAKSTTSAATSCSRPAGCGAGNSTRTLRIGFHYFNGKSNQFEFFDQFEEQIGGGRVVRLLTLAGDAASSRLQPRRMS